ncbi:hypothetical protein [Botrimarina hoheduenensis]|uniref:PEP-CTERM protein-sorting domain-containing protein n=1 Tax=Botrimarina hoheduenensis TaxID=2528000 RepID=A0A5C5WDU5_9BACT|nr:hypothetical protein [Botrimarina hoheduenensis]TWT48313.1 hypothetical protein Pla111_00760 [Botrimarina hoheduenensis]
MTFKSLVPTGVSRVAGVARRAAFGLLLCCCATNALAAPLTGLTRITSTPIFGGSPTVTSDTAYVSVSSEAPGVWAVTDSGSVFTPAPLSPAAPISSLTRVTEANDGHLYYAVNYGIDTSGLFGGAALYSLSNPSFVPVVWGGDVTHGGVRRDLVGAGTVDDFIGGGSPVFLLPNGEVSPMELPDGSAGAVYSATPNGYAIGSAVVPMTIGNAPAVWDPEGRFRFVETAGSPVSIRDRADGQGVNIGLFSGFDIIYGDQPPIELRGPNSDFPYSGFPIVTEGDFVVVAPELGNDYYAFYPGIIPGTTDRMRPLLEVFPQLSALDNLVVSGATSMGGNVYLTIRAADGLYLFGAPDPSLIPEPTTAALCCGLLVGASLRSRARA